MAQGLRPRVRSPYFFHLTEEHHQMKLKLLVTACAAALFAMSAIAQTGGSTGASGGSSVGGSTSGSSSVGGSSGSLGGSSSTGSTIGGSSTSGATTGSTPSRCDSLSGL